MADAPDPDAPHQHLFHPHLLAQARTEAARTGSAHQVWCVICCGPTSIGPGATARAPAPSSLRSKAHRAATLEQVTPDQHESGLSWCQQVRGAVGVAAPTTARGLVRLRVGGVVVFASHASGLAEALRAAGARGEAVRVGVERVGGDLYVREVVAL